MKIRKNNNNNTNIRKLKGREKTDFVGNSQHNTELPVPSFCFRYEVKEAGKMC